MSAASYQSIIPSFCAQILDRLRKDLPESLYYHSADHTIDVIEEAYRFASEDNLTEREIELLLIAACFHDAGYLYPDGGDEEIGSDMAARAMKESGAYTKEEIAAVRTAIMDTKLILNEGTKTAVQIPSTKLSKYLLDADMSNLGRDDFLKKAELVAKEHQKLVTDPSFYEQMCRITKSKVWHSPAGKKLRQEKHLENLKALLSSR